MNILESLWTHLPCQTVDPREKRWLYERRLPHIPWSWMRAMNHDSAELEHQPNIKWQTAFMLKTKRPICEAQTWLSNVFRVSYVYQELSNEYNSEGFWVFSCETFEPGDLYDGTICRRAWGGCLRPAGGVLYLSVDSLGGPVPTALTADRRKR